MLELRSTVNRLRSIIPALFGGIALVVAGCSTNAPSHVPNPVLLPAYAAGNALQNASYNARRSKVKAYVSRSIEDILHDIQAGGGPKLNEGYDLAGVAAGRRPALTAMLKREPNLRQDVEALTVSLMVHGD